MRYRSAFDELFDVFREFDDVFMRPFADFFPEAVSGTRLLPSGKPNGSSLATRAGGSRPFVAGRSWVPAVESFVKNGELFLRMELPGIDPKDVKVSITGDRLEISGEKKATQEVDESEVYFREARYGRFERSFRIPEGIRGEDVKARYRNGVLELTLPSPADAAPRRIPIEVGSGSEAGKAV